MGRAKVTLEYIKNEKNRTKSFKSRTKILKKKAHELKTLCDVDLCMIIHGPSIEGRSIIAWPPNRDEIRPLIESYNKQSDEDRKSRTVDLVDFLRERNKKVEGDLAKLRKSNDAARFAMWDERYEQCSEMALREITGVLEKKLDEAKMRIDEIKGFGGAGAQDTEGYFLRGSEAQRYSLESLLRPRNMHWEVANNEAQKMDGDLKILNIPSYYQHQQAADKQVHQQLDTNIFANQMFMMLDDNNYIYNNYNSKYFNDPPVTGMVENASGKFPQPPPMMYYTPSMQAVPPCLQYPKAAASNFSQLGSTQMEKYYM